MARPCHGTGDAREDGPGRGAEGKESSRCVVVCRRRRVRAGHVKFCTCSLRGSPRPAAAAAEAISSPSWPPLLIPRAARAQPQTPCSNHGARLSPLPHTSYIHSYSTITYIHVVLHTRRHICEPAPAPRDPPRPGPPVGHSRAPSGRVEPRGAPAFPLRRVIAPSAPRASCAASPPLATSSPAPASRTRVRRRGP